jgi:hypothetical protein
LKYLNSEKKLRNAKSSTRLKRPDCFHPARRGKD